MNVPLIVLYAIVCGFSVGTGFIGMVSSLLGTNIVLAIFSIIAFWGALFVTADYYHNVKRMYKRQYK